MTREEKINTIELLKDKFNDHSFFYLADSSTMTVGQVNQLRRLFFEKGIEMRVVKNTLALKALESAPEEKGYAQLFDVLKGPTAVLFTDNANAPARVIKEFRAKSDRPILKAAYIDTDVFLGDDQLELLATMKSKEELIGDIIMILQSPGKNVISALKSGGTTIAGIIKTLQERGGE
jgi:large subunit ribosomal protein L10